MRARGLNQVFMLGTRWLAHHPPKGLLCDAFGFMPKGDVGRALSRA